ncbi:invasion protein [Pectobacterium brasiliense]|uniref:HrpJ domain-containing protein n=1 Tax=Pectobacterium brasiliense TaxID=180957 RepID=UPI0004E78EE2|nr:HrpJ domain-containing protein [Pectobacterium brasiliense]KFF67184.1 invasion protein [Pectobacterium brasiliense]
MSIRSVGAVELHRLNLQNTANRAPSRVPDDAGEQVPLASLQEEMSNAAQEMADLLSAFGRFSKFGRKNDAADNDFLSSMLEDQADEKLGSLIKQVSANTLRFGNLLNFARGFFPDDSDLMLALLELMRSRKLSELQKKKVKEAIKDLNKFGDSKKIQSGINVGRIAKRFSEIEEARTLSAKDFRSSYVLFLGNPNSAGLIYDHWINEYGCNNRLCLLAFALSALVADMKTNVPGLHFDEFGPLSAKLSDARVLHTLDNSLNENFFEFPFREQMRYQQKIVDEEQIVNLYMTGLVRFDEFKYTLKEFNKYYMSLLLIKQRATVINTLRKTYNDTPGSLYADPEFRNIVLDFISALMTPISAKEKIRIMK